MISQAGVALFFTVVLSACPRAGETDPAYLPGSAVLGAFSVARNDIAVTLFAEKGSPLETLAGPYVAALAKKAGARADVRDHALVPELAKRWRVRSNGYLVVAIGDRVERIRLGERPRQLCLRVPVLDGELLHALDELRRPACRTVVLRDGRMDKLHELLKTGGLDVSRRRSLPLPADVCLLVVSPPVTPEVDAAAAAFVKGGGSLVVAAGSDAPPNETLEAIGAKAGTVPLVAEKFFVRTSGGPDDKRVLATDVFADHASMTLLKRTKRPIAVPGPVRLTLPKNAAPLFSAKADVFEDRDGDRRPSDEERTPGVPLGAALESSSGARVVVLAGAGLLDDRILAASQINAALIHELARWAGRLDSFEPTPRPERPPPKIVEECVARAKK